MTLSVVLSLGIYYRLLTDASQTYETMASDDRGDRGDRGVYTAGYYICIKPAWDDNFLFVIRFGF